MTLATSRAGWRGVKLSRVSASATGKPMTLLATTRALREVIRTSLAVATTRITGTDSRAMRSFQRRAPLGVVAMAAVATGHGELSELVADHGLGDEDGVVLAPVMDGDGVADHLREDVAATGPRLDDLLLVVGVQPLDLEQQVLVAEGAFFQGAAHGLLLPPTHDHAIGLLVAACPIAKRRLAPGGLRIAACTAPALAASVGMIKGVHRHAPNRRPPAAPAGLPRFADVLVLMIDVADLADRRRATDVDPPHLSGGHANGRLGALLGHQLSGATGAADQLAAPAHLHLEVVDGRAQRDVSERQRIARFDLRAHARAHRCAHCAS